MLIRKDSLQRENRLVESLGNHIVNNEPLLLTAPTIPPHSLPQTCGLGRWKLRSSLAWNQTSPTRPTWANEIKKHQLKYLKGKVIRIDTNNFSRTNWVFVWNYCVLIRKYSLQRENRLVESLGIQFVIRQLC